MPTSITDIGTIPTSWLILFASNLPLLRLLFASKQAGKTGHDNEIISILEELKEAGIIKDFKNVQM